MAGRWELTEEQWEMVEPVLRPERRSDNRGRPWHDTRAVLNGVLIVQFACRQQMCPAAAPASELTHWEFALTITMPLAL